MTRARKWAWAVAWAALYAWVTLSRPRCRFPYPNGHVDHHTCPNGDFRHYCRESCTMCMQPRRPVPCPAALGVPVRVCTRRRGHWTRAHW